MPGLSLRFEGAALFGLGVYLFTYFDEPWWLFALLFLVPDLSMLGYAGGARLGSWAYDIVHLEVWPIGLLIYALNGDHLLAGAIAGVWAAHIGIDRLLGFGLKYETDFKDTHLQHV